VTSPVAFLNLEKRGIGVLHPDRTVGTPDHNVPTVDQDKTIKDKLSRMQVERLRENCKNMALNFMIWVLTTMVLST
jgi:3-isopropylmalate/(R)-2-methylmalate dehydratase large subunit